MEHYLDNSATTRVCPEAAEAAMLAMTEIYGNPSSTHTKGREAKQLLDKSRKQVADALGCTVQELVFTSCGSESDNWAILNGAELMRRKGMHIISSQVEHDAVRKSLDELERRGFEVTRLKPDDTGAIPVQAVMEALRPDTVLVTLMLVNNETGAVTVQVLTMRTSLSASVAGSWPRPTSCCSMAWVSYWLTLQPRVQQ